MVATVAMTAAHWSGVAAVYAQGIATGHATFEETVPSWDDFDASRLPDHRFVAEEDGTVLGWVAVSPTSSRCVYDGVVEHSVYVAAVARGRGIGRALLNALISSTEAAGIWTIESGIFRENEPSLVLHRAVGFRVVGIREGLGRMPYGPLAGQWRDVVLMERRSPVVV